MAFQSTIGKFKTKVMENIIHEICPNTEVITIEAFVLPENLEELLCGVTEKLDYIVDAIDTVAAKLALAEFAKKHGIPLIASMGTGNKLHPELFKIADITETSVCPLCRVMRRELKKRGIESLKVLYSTEPPLKPVPPSAQTKEQEPAGDVPKDGLEKGHPQEDAQAPRKRAIPGSVSFVPPAAGIMIAGQVIRDLTGIH